MLGTTQELLIGQIFSLGFPVGEIVDKGLERNAGEDEAALIVTAVAFIGA